MEKNDDIYKKIYPKISLNKRNINKNILSPNKDIFRIRLMNINKNTRNNNNNNIKQLKIINNKNIDNKIKKKTCEKNDENDFDFFDFMKFDLKRKIKHKDISWDKKEFDIWNPSFTNSDNEKEEKKNKKNKILKIN